MTDIRRPAGTGYVVAVLAAAAAVLLRWLLDPWLGDYQVFTPLYGAVALTVWFGGYRPAIVTVVLGYLAFNWLFIEPRGTLWIESARDFVSLIAFLLSCGIIVGFGESLRLARRRAEENHQAALDKQRQLAAAQEALKAADGRKDEFLATLAHELRNPLAPVRNAVEILQQAGDDPALIEEARRIMVRQLGHMVRLIDDLMDISRITRGNLQLRRERVELAATVKSGVEETGPLIEASGHELTVNLPPEPVYLDADPIRLAQIFSNLLGNAAKYTDNSGQIWLTAERRDSDISVSVRDTGIGIGSKQLPHIFEMFSQVTPALERSQGGLGIGLALVRRLVELHGGTIEAHSNGPGMGSEFIVRLPVVEVPVSEQSEEPKGDDKSQRAPKCRILVVDDNPDMTTSLAMLLRRMGHEIQTAHDGLEAVQAAAAFGPQVVLLDIGLPKMNGYEVAKKIREQQGEEKIAIIALTGWGLEKDKQMALEAGFNNHLTKPVEPAALRRLLALIAPSVVPSTVAHGPVITE